MYLNGVTKTTESDNANDTAHAGNKGMGKAQEREKSMDLVETHIVYHLEGTRVDAHQAKVEALIEESLTSQIERMRPMLVSIGINGTAAVE